MDKGNYRQQEMIGISTYMSLLLKGANCYTHYLRREIKLHDAVLVVTYSSLTSEHEL